MSSISLEESRSVIAAALLYGRDSGLKPLTVAVLDPGGHVKALEREDGSGILRPDIAIGKAWGALGMGLSSREIAAMAAERPGFFGALASLANGRLLPAPGGVLVRDSSGEIAGAVGVTGDTSDNDEAAACAGISATGYQADTGPGAG